MKQLFLIITALALFSGNVVAQNEEPEPKKQKAAVYVTGKADDDYKKVIGSQLVSAITRNENYTAVERTVDFVSALETELNDQRSGMVDINEIAKLGKGFGVNSVIIADLSEIMGALYVSARIIDVETREIKKSMETSSKVRSLDDLTELSRNVIAGLIYNEIRNKGNDNVTAGSNLTTGRDFVETVAGLNMKMVWVEGGEFLMGGTSEQGSETENNEQVIRRVKLSSYYIGECEITQSQWEKVMGTSVLQQRSKANYDYGLRGTGPNYPMYYVSWEDAQAFCQELSRMTGRIYCLPTEAQWEYAARGGKNNDDTKYSGSWSIYAVAWYDGNSGLSTHPVKNKRANSLGLYDMSGNVWEWCSDWYGDNYNVNDTNNPTGPSSGSYRVLRGGSWCYDAQYCRVSYRSGNSPGYRDSSYGFRVVVLP